MNVTAKFPVVGSSGHTARFRAQPRVEKANASNAPHGERRDNDVRTIARSPSQPRARLSQIETARYEPDWNGSRLLAPFVAQVLGQVLTPDNEDRRSALSAYRGDAQVFCALLYDRRA
jgi:hypothetical protein